MASIEKYFLTGGSARYRVRYRKPDGRSTDKAGFRAKRDAEAWEAQNVLDLNAGAFVNEAAKKQKVAPFIARHLAVRGPKPATVANRRNISRVWVEPKWGEWQIGRITKTEVQDWVDSMDDAGAGTDLQEKASAILKFALTYAVEARLIPSNPVTGIKIRKREAAPNVYLDHKQVLELIDAAHEDDRLLIETACYTGLRFGEISELRADDLARGRIEVTRAVNEVDGVLVVGPPKNGKSRSVPVPAQLLRKLEKHTEWLPSDALVFCSPDGYQLRLSTWRPRRFYKAIDTVNTARGKAAAGKPYERFPEITPHGMRDTFASLVISAGGVNILALSKVMGHAKPSITLDVYGGLYPDDLEHVATALGAALEPHIGE